MHIQNTPVTYLMPQQAGRVLSYSPSPQQASSHPRFGMSEELLLPALGCICLVMGSAIAFFFKQAADSEYHHLDSEYHHNPDDDEEDTL